MLSENLSEAIRNEFFALLNTIEPGTTLRDILRQEIAETCGLMQKYDHACTDDEGNVYRDEVARHHAEMEVEKRREANDKLKEHSEEKEKEGVAGTFFLMLLEARSDWMEFDE